MKESILTFGPHGGLVGILTEPDSDRGDRNRPAILLLNAGLLHRPGPFRLYVEIARRLADLGFATLRFDFSGLGDSFTRKDNRSDEERTTLDVQEAMNCLAEKKGIREFVLMGLCAGAERAHPVAVLDARVRGVVHLDGFGYRNLGFFLRYPRDKVLHYARRILFLTKWKKKLKELRERFFHKNNGEQGSEGDPQAGVRVFPPKKDFIADVTALVGRGVDLLFVYTGGIDYYNYEGQFKDTFGSLGAEDKLQVRYFPKADHAFTWRVDRNQLFQALEQWFVNRFKDGGQEGPNSSKNHLVGVDGSHR